MKIIFFGSDDFALTNLDKLVNNGFKVVACVTQPDKARGRGMKVSASSIKDYCDQNKIPVLQPKSITEKSFIKELESFECDIFAVVAYGKILPQIILDIPDKFCVNVHASLLPAYRGAAPINWAILNGDKTTGVTIIKMNDIMDAGDILSQVELPINDADDSVSLRARLAAEGAQLLISTLQNVQSGRFKTSKQDLTKVTHAGKLSRELGVIDWNDSALKIHNMIRGLLPWPRAYTNFKGKTLKILKSRPEDYGPRDHSPGEVISVTDDGILVATGKEDLLIKEVHLESSKAMDAKSFAAGHKIKVGTKLG